MGGGLMQIVVKGPQDYYLTNKPKITYFKNVFKRYCNFSCENVKLIFNKKPEFDQTVKCVIPKFGDLITKMYLQIILKSNDTQTWSYVKKIGLAIIKDISLSLDGEIVESHTNQILNMLHEIEKKSGQESNYNSLVGNVDNLIKITENHKNYKIHLPLKFWFCKYNSSALPILCLQDKLISINVTLNEKLKCINYEGNTVPTNLPEIQNIYLLADYIYLDSNERNKYIINKHQYLIEQVQFNNFKINKYNPTFELKFGNPCKSIYWFSNQRRYTERTSYLSWALDNNWIEAKNNFAKLVYLATRNGLSADGLTISYNPTTFNPGDSPDLISGGNSILESLVSKIDAYILFYDSTSVEATIDNVALIRNEITYEDMTKTITELKNDSSNTTNQSTFFDLHKINIIDIFNTGNFVDGSDNPIITSDLKINGHSILNLKNKYFNYQQSIQKYKNSIQDGLNLYSFAFQPLKLQPSGSYNLTKIDNLTLSIKIGKDSKDDEGSYFTNNFVSGDLTVFIINYNLLKISDGKAKIFYNIKKK